MALSSQPDTITLDELIEQLLRHEGKQIDNATGLALGIMAAAKAARKAA